MGVHVKVSLIFLITSRCCLLAFGVDPCFDLTNEDLGSIGNCIPEASCDSDVTVSGVCPSFPFGYTCCFSDSFPGRESRGAWIASVANIDWPNSPSDSVAVQQASLERLIDTLAEAGFNTVYFQVRPAGDALYQSAIEPWSRYLTGSQGQEPNPLWDPLEFIIDYAHSKNIQVHAWINPYRASMSSSKDGLAPNHMANLYPEFAYPYDTFLWMDPGAEVVQNRTFDVVMDIVKRYDLDGLHMDDYFYPYPVSGVPFPDVVTYADYILRNGTLSLEDWRRDNVNKLIQRLNNGIHEAKSWVVFSVSPFGIYRPCQTNGMPCSISGLDQYSEIYCDAKLWLQQGWVDVLQPQLYWKIDPPKQSYPVLLNWWVEPEQNPMGRHVYAGNYLSRLITDGWPLSEIHNQIKISREARHRSRGSWGNAQFSAQVLGKNIENAVAYFKNNIYQYPALQPQYPWLAQGQPKPSLPNITVTNQGLIYLQMDAIVEQHSAGSGKIYKIVTYRQDESRTWSLYKVIQLPHVVDSLHLEYRLEPGHYAIHAEDRFGQESKRQYLHTQ